MLKRSSLSTVNKKLSKEKHWNILDIGCGYRANENATVIADIKDFSNFYKDKRFIKIDKKELPFKNKEFDYVIASHVIEHVEDFEFFIKEIQRISSRGYIELPSRLADNLVFENVNDHIWWFQYDDINNRLISSKKNQLIDPFVTVATSKILEKVFRESLIIELEWENSIDYIIDETLKEEKFEKISFYKIIKKYFSKRLRRLFK